jgi:hypothetical protein
MQTRPLRHRGRDRLTARARLAPLARVASRLRLAPRLRLASRLLRAPLASRGMRLSSRMCLACRAGLRSRARPRSPSRLTSRNSKHVDVGAGPVAIGSESSKCVLAETVTGFLPPTYAVRPATYFGQYALMLAPTKNPA